MCMFCVLIVKALNVQSYHEVQTLFIVTPVTSSIFIMILGLIPQDQMGA